ncbi:MAG TPA: prepilin-type N-terminal cleavage/methylation domain-containing protein [Stellaceae bacterium]|nr:prepilin-type N-terminal cleavage/methylation domain-containing protein [Stellaceae bacterium]
MSAGRLRSAAGFTLLELLIGIAVLGLLMGMLFGGLRLASHQVEWRTARLDRGSRVTLVQAFMRRSLADARPLEIEGSRPSIAGPTVALAFDGTAEELEFVGPAPESAESGGLELIGLGLVRRGAAAGALSLRVRAYDTGAGGATAPLRETLVLEGVRQAQFAYFGVIAGETAPRWHESWRELPYLPALVRLTLTLSGGERVPDLVVALRLSQDPSLWHGGPERP